MFDDMDENSLFDDDEGDDFTSLESGLDDELPLPRNAAFCLGHDDIEKQLITAWENDRLPHAIIFSGPEGIGKATMAYRLARFLFKNGVSSNGADEGPGLFGDALPDIPAPDNLDVDIRDPVFMRVSSGGHPDFLVVERPFDEAKGRKQGVLPVDEIREIPKFIQHTASQDGWRIVIVDDADLMNRNSQNAILKALEEPPEHTVIILVTHRLGALVPTIRSRCRVLTFQPLDKENYTNLLTKLDPAISKTDIDILYEISAGSIGKGIRILDEGGLEMVTTLTGILNNWPNWDWPVIHKLSDSMSRKNQDETLQAFSEIFLWIFENIVRSLAKGTELPSALNNDTFSRLRSSFSLAEWIGICDNLREHFITADFGNLDNRHAVLGAFSLLNKEKQAA